jgi:hypothetical protein
MRKKTQIQSSSYRLKHHKIDQYIEYQPAGRRSADEQIFCKKLFFTQMLSIKPFGCIRAFATLTF